MHHFPLTRSFPLTSAGSPPPPSVSPYQATHPSFHQDYDRSPWWDEDLEEEGGGGVLMSHHVIWEVGEKFREGHNALIHAGGPFQSIYLCVFDLLLLLHIQVMSNQSALIFYWCSGIYPSWGARFNSSALFPSIPVWHPYHSPLPHFHISYLHFLNGDNCPL